MKVSKAIKDPQGVIEMFMPADTGRPNVQMGLSTMMPGEETEFSSHPGDEYSFVLQGACICYTEDGEEHLTQKGDAIFTPAGQRHKSKCIGDEQYICTWTEVAL